MILFLSLLLFVCGIGLAGLAAYISVLGFHAIFPVTMTYVWGGAIEASKIVTTMWLHANWQQAGKIKRLFLAGFIAIAMTFTSIGIYGYLSKSHLETTESIETNTLQIELLETQISQQRAGLKRNNDTLELLDSASQEWIERGYITRAMQDRAEKEPERNLLQEDNTKRIAELERLQLELTRLKGEVQAVEREVGPIKYVARLIYGDVSKTDFEKAVTILMLFVVVIFDPFALFMLTASQEPVLLRKRVKKEPATVHKIGLPSAIDIPNTVAKPKRKKPEPAPNIFAPEPEKYEGAPFDLESQERYEEFTDEQDDSRGSSS